MREHYVLDLLNRVKDGNMSPEEAVMKLKHLPFDDIGYAKVDNHRELRTGYPEVIYGEGKSVEQIEGIMRKMSERGSNILATRIDSDKYSQLKDKFENIEYYSEPRILFLKNHEIKISKYSILIVTGGTSDIPVAEEAAITAEKLGNRVERLYDVGVAGIHRLLSKQEKIKEANVIIAVAGMEGALASVVGGLTDKPVIAVPTSIGYGASFGGLASLLAMLNSCASGIGVVNIDNGFGAGYLAASIIRQIEENSLDKRI